MSKDSEEFFVKLNRSNTVKEPQGSQNKGAQAEIYNDSKFVSKNLWFKINVTDVGKRITKVARWAKT